MDGWALPGYFLRFLPASLRFLRHAPVFLRDRSFAPTLGYLTPGHSAPPFQLSAEYPPPDHSDRSPETAPFPMSPAPDMRAAWMLG